MYIKPFFVIIRAQLPKELKVVRTEIGHIY